MENRVGVGAVQVAGGGYLAYKGIEQGLPRALGLRIEYHTTSKKNAELIKKAGNFLDPQFGGKGGWSETVNNAHFIQNSKNYVHITGVHPDHKEIKEMAEEVCKKLPKGIRSTSEKLVSDVIRPINRRMQCVMYKTVGNTNGKMGVSYSENMKETLKEYADIFYKNNFKNKTKRFCIPGIDSYFKSEFIPDCDDIALKSSKKLKVYSNRFSAMFAGLKKFGLKGMKENKSRVAAGIAIMSLSLCCAGKLIKKGISNITGVKQTNSVKLEKDDK